MGGLARQFLRARTLLKANASEVGEACSDGQIATALDTSTDSIARTRWQLVEEGLDAALSRKHSPNSAGKSIFDSAAGAKPIAPVCSPPPKERERWTPALLESAVIELNIVDRASGNTISRTPKKPTQARSLETMGHPARGQCRSRTRHGGWVGSLSEAA